MPADDALWFKDAVFYEVPVRSFFDSNGDGKGDFRGLAQKLDYIRDLGVDCIWVLPMYPSPNLDDGYDIADFLKIHPDYGNVSDFILFIDAAHARGLKVVADLVLNHTSDQHAWFQEARNDPSSPRRNYYVICIQWQQLPVEYRRHYINNNCSTDKFIRLFFACKLWNYLFCSTQLSHWSTATTPGIGNRGFQRMQGRSHRNLCSSRTKLFMEHRRHYTEHYTPGEHSDAGHLDANEPDEWVQGS